MNNSFLPSFKILLTKYLPRKHLPTYTIYYLFDILKVKRIIFGFYYKTENLLTNFSIVVVYWQFLASLSFAFSFTQFCFFLSPGLYHLPKIVPPITNNKASIVGSHGHIIQTVMRWNCVNKTARTRTYLCLTSDTVVSVRLTCAKNRFHRMIFNKSRYGKAELRR